MGFIKLVVVAIDDGADINIHNTCIWEIDCIDLPKALTITGIAELKVSNIILFEITYMKG